MTRKVSSRLVLLHHADPYHAARAHHSQMGVHLLNVLLLKTHNIASAVRLPRAGKNLPRFKERGYL